MGDCEYFGEFFKQVFNGSITLSEVEHTLISSIITSLAHGDVNNIIEELSENHSKLIRTLRKKIDFTELEERELYLQIYLKVFSDIAYRIKIYQKEQRELLEVYTSAIYKEEFESMLELLAQRSHMNKTELCEKVVDKKVLNELVEYMVRHRLMVITKIRENCYYEVLPRGRTLFDLLEQPKCGRRK